jgi:phosphatidylserine decarboxylase
MPRIAREGFLPASIVGALTVGLFLLFGVWPAFAGVVATLAVVLFFRDPERKIEHSEGEILSAADGRVVAVDDKPSHPTDQWGLRVSVFMSVFNVHINRIPVDGKVISVRHIPGGFAMAHLDEAGISNERTEILLEDRAGRRYLLVQVAGLVARRIVCRLSENDEIGTGQRFGLICFGSRVDLYMPPGVSPCVAAGDRVKAGTSVLARVR